MLPDLTNQLNTVLVDARTAAANFNAAVVDIGPRGFQGKIEFVIIAGVGAGTNPTVDLYLTSSATNNIDNGVNLNLAITQIANTNSMQIIQVDPRVANRYVFPRVIVAGTNAAIPLSIHTRGVKQVQP